MVEPYGFLSAGRHDLTEKREFERGASSASRERRRLEALASYHILDTPREPDFDEVAELAAEICETPIAVVNLIAAERQFFKAEVGLGVRETPLESSFCAKAILEEDFLEVPDATRDPRFDCNPLVTGDAGLRFYAGKLLKTIDGLPIGTLCVLDTRPRALTSLQRRALDVLGRQLMSQIELRRVIKQKDDLLAQRNLIQQETTHRLKNTMTMVQAIASQTLRKDASRGALAEFQARMQSLASAHDILLRQEWDAADMEAVLREVVGQVAPLDRFRINGPAVKLGARAALSTSLIAHELATNAMKHGALSSDVGRIEISWSVAGDLLTLNWEETGGPPAVRPARVGFGSKLINLGLVGSGSVDLRYEPTGLRVVLTASLEELRLP